MTLPPAFTTGMSHPCDNREFLDLIKQELTNQPHKHYNEKNEAILKIDKLFHDSEYLGELTKEQPNDDFTSFLFETEIAAEKSWIIVRKYDRGEDYLIYSISDQPVITNFLKKKEDH